MKKLLFIAKSAFAVGLTVQSICAMDPESAMEIESVSKKRSLGFAVEGESSPKRQKIDVFSIESLPDDMLGLIYVKCEHGMFCENVSLVCKKWKNLSDKITHRIIVNKANNSDLIQLSERFKNIRELVFKWYDNNITDEAITKFPALISLKLGSKDTITDAAIITLTALASLNLECNHDITDEAITKLPALTKLNLGANYMITEVAITQLPALTSLTLGDNEMITDAAIIQLPALTSLNLRDNIMITDAAITQLPALTSLNLEGNNTITRAVLKKFPNCIIKR